MVDNNSTDGTGEIAASYGVTVVRGTCAGVCQARQRGTIEARGEIVVSTDADTVQARDWLTRIDRQFRARTESWPLLGRASTTTLRGGPASTRSCSSERWTSLRVDRPRVLYQRHQHCVPTVSLPGI